MRGDIEMLERRMREQGASLVLLSRLAELYRKEEFAERALSLFLEASMRAWAAEQMDEAVALLVRCLEIDPENRNVRAMLASMYTQTGKLAEARDALNSAAAEYARAGNVDALAATRLLLDGISDSEKLGRRLAAGGAAHRPPRAPTDAYDLPPACSFCGKDQTEVRKLIAGPAVYICNECVHLCQRIIDEDIKPVVGDGQGNERPDDLRK